MFFISHGKLFLFYNRLSTCKKSIQLRNDTEIIKMNMLSSDPSLTIVIVSNIFYFDKENVLAVELYDYVSNYPFVLDKSKWSLVDKIYFSNDSNDSIKVKSTSLSNEMFKEGSVIILKEYSFANVEIIDNKENNLPENEEFYLEDVVTLIDFYIIGEEKNFKYVENNNKILDK